MSRSTPASKLGSAVLALRTHDTDERHPITAARAEYQAILSCRHHYELDTLVCRRCGLPFERIQQAVIYAREKG